MNYSIRSCQLPQWLGLWLSSEYIQSQCFQKHVAEVKATLNLFLSSFSWPKDSRRVQRKYKAVEENVCCPASEDDGSEAARCISKRTYLSLNPHTHIKKIWVWSCLCLSPHLWEEGSGDRRIMGEWVTATSLAANSVEEPDKGMRWGEGRAPPQSTATLSCGPSRYGDPYPQKQAFLLLLHTCNSATVTNDSNIWYARWS